jgi:predicted alpha/beta hydrolase
MSIPHLQTRIYRIDRCLLEIYWDTPCPSGLSVLNIPCQPTLLEIRAADGTKIAGFQWRHKVSSHEPRSVVIINPATSVRCRYYARFAEFLCRAGLDVLTYDYRGIGESRPKTLAGFDAGWIDWGERDFEAVLRYAGHSFPGQPIDVVAHSVGGFVIGLAESNHRIRRVFSMGAQYAYWRDYAADRKWRMLLKWNIAMPMLTLIFGYFPGKRLGWLEDTPKGVVRDWVLSRERFEDTWRSRASSRYPSKATLVQRFSAVTAPILAVSVADDEFGTPPAIERLLKYFRCSTRHRIRISPQAISEKQIGHFGFFHSRFEKTLWPIALTWLTTGRIEVGWPGELISSAEGQRLSSGPAIAPTDERRWRRL